MEFELNDNRIGKSVREINLSEIFEPRIIQFNGIKSLAPFGAVGETLDAGVVFLPKYRRIFQASGICFSVEELQQKIYSSNLFYRDLITKDVRRQLRWLYDIRKKEPELYKEFLQFRVNVDLSSYPDYDIPVPEYLENFKTDVINYRNLYRPDNFDSKHINFKEDAIEAIAGRFSEYSFFREMSSYKTGVWLKKQIANINTVALYLNPEKVDENYLKLFLRSWSGYIFFQKWQRQCIDEGEDVLSAMRKMTILLPDLQDQKRIGEKFADCLERQRKSKREMSELSDLVDQRLKEGLIEWANFDFPLKDYVLGIIVKPKEN
jgi:hypothetical protein